MFEKGVSLGLLVGYIFIVGSLYGCGPQQNNLRKDVHTQEMPSVEIEIWWDG